jgi:hypothetical protein
MGNTTLSAWRNVKTHWSHEPDSLYQTSRKDTVYSAGSSPAALTKKIVQNVFIMKITKRNTPPDKIKWSGWCRACGSEAEAEQSEMTSITHDLREGGMFAWVKCPVCQVGPYGGMLFYPAALTNS